MNGSTKGLVIFVIIVHVLFFLLEAILWKQPWVYNILVRLLKNSTDLGYPEQAIVLKNLFINQGMYNFFLACIGVLGLYLISNKSYTTGYTLILVLCFFGMGAGLVLAFSTRAWVFAIAQGIPAAFAFVQVLSLYKLSG